MALHQIDLGDALSGGAGGRASLAGCAAAFCRVRGEKGHSCSRSATSSGVVVDTHVQRISQRLAWTKHTEPIEIEQDLMKVIPKPEWDRVSHVLIFHGRRICFARKPNCEGCPVNDACPSAFVAENIGRKGPRPPRSRG